MIFTETELPGAFVIDLELREDERGFFARSWCAHEFAERGLATDLAQMNIAFNERAGTLRGMHFQRTPHEEAKVVRCTGGSVYDVIIDLRPASKTYCRWISVVLSAENRRALYVPEGFAHGYQTLEDASETFYLVSELYAPESAAGVRWDDPAFGVEWPPAEERIMTQRDASWPDFDR